MFRLLLALCFVGAGRAHAQSDVVPPRPLFAPAPVYPEAAREQGLEGRVVMRLRISSDGAVLQGRITESTDTLFNRPALAAVRLWWFRPARQANRPVPAWVVLPIRFQPTGVATSEAYPVAVKHVPDDPPRLTFDRRDAAPLRNPDGCRSVTAPVLPAPAALDVRAARAHPDAVFRLGLWVLVRGDGSLGDLTVDSLDAPPGAGAAFVRAVEQGTRRLDRVVPARCDGVAVDAWYRGRYAYMLRPEGATVVVDDARTARRVRPALVFAPTLVFD